MSNPATTPLHAIVHSAIGWSLFLSIVLILAGLFAILIPPISGLGVTIFLGWMLIISGATHLIFAWKVHVTSRKLWEILVGALYLFAGIYLILHPLAGLLSLTLFLAAYLFVEGIIELVLAFKLRPAPNWGWTLFDGVITIILGLMIWLTWPASTAWAIGTLVGISMLFSGISRLMLTLAAKRALEGVV
jgi:uncharacterized membrane protein HdeD (DUF308 family)